jgi:hypothetical protein
MIIEKNNIKIDTEYNYKHEIDPLAEEWLLRRDKDILKNFKDNKLIVNFHQFDEKEVLVDGVKIMVPNKGIYLRYEPWAEGQVVYRLLQLSGISKQYQNEKAWIEEKEYGAWMPDKGQGRDIQGVFHAFVNALRDSI